MINLKKKAQFFKERAFYTKLCDARTLVNRHRYFHNETLLEKVEPEDFEKVKEILDDLQGQGIIGDWIIGGGAAVTYYTLAIPSIDIDIFSTYQASSMFEPYGKLYSYLAKKYGARVEAEMIVIDGLYLQFLPSDSSSPVDVEAQQHPLITEDGLRLFELEYLICSMLYLGTPKYKIRLQHLKAEAQYDEEKLRRLLLKFGLDTKWRVI
jgi:hypothetical protein